jgi:hypothetical protein
MKKYLKPEEKNLFAGQINRALNTAMVKLNIPKT